MRSIIKAFVKKYRSLPLDTKFVQYLKSWYCLYLHPLNSTMLSRRNVRVKVLQALYAQNRDKTLNTKKTEALYRQSIQDSYKLYLLNLFQLYKVAEYVYEDAKIRSAKHLPTEEDKLFSTKLFDNPIMQMVAQSNGFLSLVKKDKLSRILDKDITRKLYNEFAKTELFKAYLLNSDSKVSDDREVLLALYKSMIKNELFDELVGDRYANWEIDKSLVVGAIKKTLKLKEFEPDFYERYYPDNLTVDEFGGELVYKSLHFNEDFSDLIKPKLENWEMERVAVIDMLLIKMALCELIYFPSIPTKVTINEFVDISKVYSTIKSKEFINGVLDKLMKQLKNEGKINKKGRGLVD